MRYLIVLQNGHREDFWVKGHRDLIARITELVEHFGSPVDLLYCLGKS